MSEIILIRGEWQILDVDVARQSIVEILGDVDSSASFSVEVLSLESEGLERAQSIVKEFDVFQLPFWVRKDGDRVVRSEALSIRAAESSIPASEGSSFPLAMEAFESFNLPEAVKRCRPVP